MEREIRRIMELQFNIENLKCGGCANTIIKEIGSLEDVLDVTVSVDTAMVIINANSDVSVAVKEKLSQLGYPEVGDKNSVIHKAKSFVSCAVGRVKS